MLDGSIEVRINAASKLLGSLLSIEESGELGALIADLEEQSASPELWEDRVRAQKVTSSLAQKKKLLTQVRQLSATIADLGQLHQMASADDDDKSIKEIESELSRVEAE